MWSGLNKEKSPQVSHMVKGWNLPTVTRYLQTQAGHPSILLGNIMLDVMVVLSGIPYTHSQSFNTWIVNLCAERACQHWGACSIRLAAWSDIHEVRIFSSDSFIIDLDYRSELPVSLSVNFAFTKFSGLITNTRSNNIQTCFPHKNQLKASPRIPPIWASIRIHHI
jgi:hypothetical protein